MQALSKPPHWAAWRRSGGQGAGGRDEPMDTWKRGGGVDGGGFAPCGFGVAALGETSQEPSAHLVAALGAATAADRGGPLGVQGGSLDTGDDAVHNIKRTELREATGCGAHRGADGVERALGVFIGDMVPSPNQPRERALLIPVYGLVRWGPGGERDGRCLDEERPQVGIRALEEGRSVPLDDGVNAVHHISVVDVKGRDARVTTVDPYGRCQLGAAHRLHAGSGRAGNGGRAPALPIPPPMPIGAGAGRRGSMRCRR